MTSKLAMLAAAAAAGLVFAAGPAAAYIGPGAGLSLLGALWGVIAAVFAALLFLLVWPLRRFMRRQRAGVERAAARPAGERPQGAADPQRR